MKEFELEDEKLPRVGAVLDRFLAIFSPFEAIVYYLHLRFHPERDPLCSRLLHPSNSTVIHQLQNQLFFHIQETMYIFSKLYCK